MIQDEQFHSWGPDIISIVLMLGHLQTMIIGMYIPPTGEEEIYSSNIVEVQLVAEDACQSNMNYMIIGDLNHPTFSAMLLV